MKDTLWQEAVGKRVWLLQLIVGAMLGGVLIFLGIAVVLVQLDAVPTAKDIAPVMTIVLLAVTGVEVAVGGIVPQVMVSRARRRIREGTWQLPQAGAVQPETVELLERTGDAGKLWLVYVTRTIVAAAMPEGVAFLACITYLMERSSVGLVVAAIMTAWILLQMPTQARVTHWIEQQLQRMEEERLLSG